MPASRRKFLSAAALLAGVRRLSASAAPDLHFPAVPRERIAVSSYPFRQFIDTPRNRSRNPQGPLMSLKEFPAMVAQRFHVQNVELLGEHIYPTELSNLDELRTAVKSAHSHVVNIPAGLGASVYDVDSGRRAAAVEAGRKWVDVAGALECPSVRVHIQSGRGVSPDAGLAAESLGRIAEYGASKNVVVNLENDDLVSEDANFIAKVIDRVQSPWLRALPDFGNSMLTGDEKVNYDAMGAMFHRAYNICHVKDSEVDHGKVFRVDLARTFAIAKATGYLGYFSMEFEGEGDPYAGTQRLIDASLKSLE